MLPRYTPMAPARIRDPFHRDGWIYEEKVDGWRIVAYKAGDRVRLVSRNGRDHTRRFRDIAAAIAKLSARTLVLDGEVAVYDQQLRSRFDWLREPDPNAVATPPLFMAFDLLDCNGRDISTRGQRDWRTRLEDARDADRGSRLARAGRLDGTAATVACLQPPLERLANRCTHGRVVCVGVTYMDIQGDAAVAERKRLDGRDEASQTSRHAVRRMYRLRVIAGAESVPPRCGHHGLLP